MSAQRYYERLTNARVAPLWRIPGTTDPEPAADEVPYVWRWRDIGPLLYEAAQVMSPGDDAERRALNAFNPARQFGTTHTLVAGYQLVLPGETAPAHRHTPAAIRFMLEGSGQTVVDGEPVRMEPGDLVLTPGMTWHDHRQDGDGAMVWLDGLDVPFVRAMRANFYEDFPRGELQPLTRPEGDSGRRYGVGLASAGRRPAPGPSPLLNYKWDTSYSALRDLRGCGTDPHEAVRLEYVNPLTGGHVLPTMACYLSLLDPAASTAALRHTSSTVFCVVRGSGHSIVGGTRLDWSRNDFFAVPAWTWYTHHAAGDEVVLFSMCDRPLLEPFGLYREQRSMAGDNCGC
jgi:gentisate 1,2-dioxygenase